MGTLPSKAIIYLVRWLAKGSVCYFNQTDAVTYFDCVNIVVVVVAVKENIFSF